MGVEHLHIPGRKNSGYIEKFADGCMALGNAFWFGNRHVVIQQKDKEYQIHTEGTSRTITDKWASVTGALLDMEPFGVFCSGALWMVYGCLGAVAGLFMGIGLGVKSIALSTDEKAKKYNDVAYAYLQMNDKKEHIHSLKKRHLNLASHIKRHEVISKSSIETQKILEDRLCKGDELLDPDRVREKKKLEQTQIIIKKLSDKLNGIQREIERDTESMDQLQERVKDLTKAYLGEEDIQVIIQEKE